ncbi:hypothetical protein GCM10010298_69320 [Streptomyces microflavus]|uniref:Uncharacterized protein n=1 Tax=Streptomyces microflavus TaxID=1919 RepID=A0A7J0D5X1_STRMI|nr:hypothetical protein Smic_84150 [Streptomyces microflavus]GGX94150.1 hypothetical protein GCM10010298_69320 [Streptomyces microflavus]
MTCELDDLPVGRIKDVFAAAIGPSRDWINWELLCWPDAPELGFLGERKHAEVSLSTVDGGSHLVSGSARTWPPGQSLHVVRLVIRSWNNTHFSH